MSSRQTRAEIMEQSVITTRARAQKLNDTNESSTKLKEKTKQSRRKRKSSVVKDNLEADTKRSAKKDSLNAKVTFSKPVKKKVSRRRLKLVDEVEAEDKAIAHENRSTDSNESSKLLKHRHSDNISTTKFIKNDIPQSSNMKDVDSDKTPKKRRKTIVASVKISPNMITPKSTPIKLNLTPHRATKTPKKSPISLGSPKTHSVAVPRLLKTPRKLSLTPWKNLDRSNNNSYDKKLQKNKRDTLHNTSISNKSLSTSSIVKNKQSKSSINLKKIVRRFSKSPKIVLRSPKTKKSRSSKLKFLSPSRVRKSPLKSPLTNIISGTASGLNDTKPLRMSRKVSPSAKGKNLSTIKRRLLNSRLMKTLTDSQIKDVLAEPVVLLERLSPKSMQTMLIVVSKNQSDTSIDVGNSNKILTPTRRKAYAGSDVSIHLKKTHRNSNAKLMRRSSDRSVSSTIQNTSIQKKNRSSIPLMSSTPQEGKKMSTDMNLTSNTINISIDDTSPNTRSKYRNQSDMYTMQLSNMTDKSTIIESVSKSLFDKDISDRNKIHLSNSTKRDVTYDVNEDTIVLEKEQEKKDITYELKQPQTQSLRRIVKKRTATDTDLSIEENVKEACKVHFANPTSNKSNMHKSVNKSIGLQSNVPHNDALKTSIINTSHKSRKIGTPRFSRNSIVSPSKAKSSSMIGGVTPRAKVNRQSHSFNNMVPNVSLNRIQTTPKVLPSSEKKLEKKSSIKKVPNFGKIHEKLFAKSESLTDAKKRLRERHLAFTQNKVLPKADVKKDIKPLLTDTNNGIHNRFGFKLRKAEATHVILKKQTVFSRQKQQHETRMVLKGVRTNRRFELQMKSRNINM